jgi:hypothetical protein
MRRVMREVPKQRRDELEDWGFSILEALNANQQLDMLKLLGPKYGIDPEVVVRMITTLPNFAEVNSLTYMHTVVPNLRKLGLLTDRTESEWRRLGMLTDRRHLEALLKPLEA